MTTKPSKKRDPNRILKRSYDGLGKFHRFLAIPFILGGGFFLFSIIRTCLATEVDYSNPQFIATVIFMLIFIAVGFYIAFNRSDKSIEPDDIHSFYPKKEADKMSMDAAIFGIAFTSFPLVLFYAAGGGGAFIFFVVGTLVVVGISVTIYRLILAFRMLQQVRKFGNSHIQLTTPIVKKGDIVNIQFKNQELFKYVNSLDIYFRNIKEAWVSSDDSKVLKAIVLYENTKRTAIQATTTNFDLEIPQNEDVYVTDYFAAEPIYWELEVRNEEVGFESFFQIEVKA